MVPVGLPGGLASARRVPVQASAGRADDGGAVTVEAALALCSLVVVLALVLAAVSAVAAQLRCVDAAREAARLTARGDRDRAEQLARRVAPRDAVVTVTVRGDEVTARVSANPVAGLLPGIEVGAEAAAILEPAAPATGAPETGAPETGAPETGAPETGAPETGAPETGAGP